MTPFQREQQKKLGLKLIKLDEERVPKKCRIFKLEALRAIVMSRNNKGKK